jgi:hypothetical protein
LDFTIPIVRVWCEIIGKSVEEKLGRWDGMVTWVG